MGGSAFLDQHVTRVEAHRMGLVAQLPDDGVVESHSVEARKKVIIRSGPSSGPPRPVERTRTEHTVGGAGKVFGYQASPDSRTPDMPNSCCGVLSLEAAR